MFVVTGQPHLDGQIFFVALRILVYTMVVPVTLAVMLLAFAATLLDCAWFRLRTAFTHNRHRKGTWEF
ncbi:MAG: hypothetical protein WB439_06300 [Acidobacteriaceae bacterium]